MIEPNFTAIQWGTSSVVARQVHSNGEVICRSQRSANLLDLGKTEISDLLAELCAEVTDAAPVWPVWLAGMIGSAMGWRDIERVACPADAANIQKGVQFDQIGNIPVAFVPGLSCVSRFGDPDVMRGEETSALGVLETYPGQRIMMFSAPGMHGKWIELNEGKIRSFHTAMTVEFAKIISDCSILRSQLEEPPVGDDVFRDGVDQGLKGGGLARLVFSVRSATLSDRITAEQAPSYLWGILIGAELHELRFEGYDQVLLAGSEQVTSLYQAALMRLGISATTISDDLSCVGLALLREQGCVSA